MSLFPGQRGPGRGPLDPLPGMGGARPARPAPARAPEPTKPRPAQLDPTAPQWKSAYPGSTTYIDLIRKNKAESVGLIAVMLALAALLGAAIGATVVVSVGDSAASTDILLRSGATGGGVALLAGGLAALWSWFGGANAILRMSGAVPLDHTADPELFNVVDEVRIAAGLPMPRVYLIPSDSLNAFATGRDPAHAALAITAGLRRVLTRDELQGVMAHEMAHVRHYDIRFAMLMATMVGLIAFASDAMLRTLKFGKIAGSSRSGKNSGGGVAVIALLVVWLLLAILAPIAAQIIHLAFSRSREYLADAGAVELTRNPMGLAGALRKLSDCRVPLDRANKATEHLFIVNPSAKACLSGQRKSSIFSTHPPIEERIRRLLALTR